MAENNKITKNSFSGGRNTDTNVSVLQPDQYQSAHNVDLVANGNFYGLQNLIGTTNLKEIANDSTIVEIGSCPCKFTINGTLTYCILYFTMSSASGTFNIWAYDTENNNLYAIYQELYENGYYTTDRTVDFINYPENDIDFVYFTDFFNELRFIKCVIPNPYTPNFLTEFDISLQRKGAVGSIVLSSISSGGNLLSGSYQFAYRTCDPENKRFTKWSSITNPVHVYDADNSSNQVHAGVGLLTDRKITLSITPSTDEANNLGFIQLAVIENIGSTPATDASLLEYTSYTTSLTFEYKANARIGTVSLDDLTVDLAQIETVKSLRVSNNRLFGGNVTYVNLVPENDPVITGGSIITRTDGSNTDCFSSDDFSSRYVGYWGDEVYRFGIVYEDGDGNKSSAIPLDLSSVTDNQITGSLTDLKFPGRNTSNQWTLFDSSGKIQTKGLQLSFSNQVTWAKKVHIVRMPRRKNILFQTPIIPMVGVNGIGALGHYPSYPVTAQGAVNNTTAQPQTKTKILVPKNLYWPELRSIDLRTTSVLTAYQNEAKLNRTPSEQVGYQFSMIFPSPNMYGDTPFVFTGTEKIDFIDRALIKLNHQSFNPTKSYGTIADGDDINTNVSGNFYSLNDGDYFFDSTWGGKSIADVDIPINAYQYFDNFGTGTSVAGVSALDYEALQTKGIAVGYQPNVQRSAVIKIETAVKDLSNNPTSILFANGTFNPFISGGEEIVTGGGLRYETGYLSTSTPTNNYVTQYPSYSSSAYVGAVSIANVKLNLNDNRYGDINSFHEYQFTGASYTFDPSEVATLEAGGTVTVTGLEVWGGDCFVGPQVFKICDSTYSIPDQISNSGSYVENPDLSVIKWQTIFGKLITSNPFAAVSAAICLPMAVENSGQYITVVLESEYNGEVRDFDVITKTISVNGMPVLNNPTKDTIRTPLSYRYNINLSKQNSQKVFTSILQHSFIQTAFNSRVLYSDLKIYNSDQAGFDVWKVADFVDLPEQRYGITKLAVASDHLFAIQEKGVIYLPIGERQVEQTDASTLAIRTGDVVGRPVVVDAQRGSQHLRGIVETGDIVYIPDNLNKSVYILSGTELTPIVKDNQTLMRSLFATQHAGNEIAGVYDFVRNQYLLIINDAIQIFNQDKQIWVGDYEAFTFGGAYQRGLYFTSFEGLTNSLCIYNMYTGDNNVIFGNTVVPRVSFVVNPDEAFAKTFDVAMIDASDQLDQADLQVVYDTSSNPSTINGLNLAVPNIENNYRIPLGTDQNGYRLRGMRMLVTVYWRDLTAQLKSFYTKYRYSKRLPF